MTRSDWWPAVLAIALLVASAFVGCGIDHTPKAKTSPKTERRTTPSAASRTLIRRPLAAPIAAFPSELAAAQTSAGNTHPIPTSIPGPADDGPGVGSDAGKRAATPGPTKTYLALRAAISWCESRNRPTVVNQRSGAAGLWQFLGSTWEAVTGLNPPASAYSVAVQTAAFDALYKLRGTQPWNASRSCWGRS